MAGVLACGPEALLSHQSAAELWEIRTPHGGPIEVTLAGSRKRGVRGLLIHRRTVLSSPDRRARHGIPVTSPTRTLADLANRISADDLESAVNEADRLDLIDPERLRQALDDMQGEAGARRLLRLLDRQVFRLTDSDLEQRFLRLVGSAGLPAPQTQNQVNGFRVDFLWPELGLVVETDGLRYHRTPAQQARDRRRDQVHTAAGLTTLRFTHAQVRFEAAEVREILVRVAARLSSAAPRPSLQSMCGRYTLTDPDPRLLRFRFGLTESAEIDQPPRYNVAPTDPVLAIRLDEEHRPEPGVMRWGLIPHYADPDSFDRLLINARAETVAEAPAFRDAFLTHRCLIVADGFYEWREEETGKQPVWITRPERDPFAFAGLWAEARRPDGSSVHSCAIVTCGPGEVVAPIHDRMPVILDREVESAWLHPEGGREELQGLLVPTDELEVTEVSDAVNDVRQDGPALIEPPLRLF
jgi:putative SOS response-associated peptidase YedK/very-short-patch-repair endonuclease